MIVKRTITREFDIPDDLVDEFDEELALNQVQIEKTGQKYQYIQMLLERNAKLMGMTQRDLKKWCRHAGSMNSLSWYGVLEIVDELFFTRSSVAKDRNNRVPILSHVMEEASENNFSVHRTPELHIILVDNTNKDLHGVFEDTETGYHMALEWLSSKKPN